MNRATKLKADSTVKRELRRLERIYQSDATPSVEARFAYAIAHAIRWAREETHGWPLPSGEPAEYARLVRDDARRGDR